MFSLKPLDFGDANSSKTLVNKGKLQVGSMFACNYILHADYHGVSGFSVSYVPIKLKFLHDIASHFGTKNVV